jgi:hypothetical protein
MESGLHREYQLHKSALPGDSTKEESLALSRMEMELQSELSELNAIFSSFEAGHSSVHRYLSEVLANVEPSVKFVKLLVECLHASELNFLKQAVQHSSNRKKVLKRHNALLFREFEENRLRELGRSASDLAQLYANIQTQLVAEIEVIDVARSSELWKLEEMSIQRRKEKQSLHDSYAEEVNSVQRQHQKERSAALSKYTSERDYVISSSEGDPSDFQNQKTLLELEQSFCVDVADKDMQYNDKLYDIFRKVTNKLFTNEKMDEELRFVRLHLRKSALISESVNDSENMKKLGWLRSNQVERRNDAKAVSEDLNKDLNGVINVLEQQKADELRFIEKLLKLKQAEREQELIDLGVKLDAAKLKAAEEREMELDAKARDLNQKYADLVKAAKTESDRNLSAEMNALRNEQSTLLDKVENGLPANTLPGYDSLVASLKETSNYESDDLKRQKARDIESLHKAIQSEKK